MCGIPKKVRLAFGSLSILLCVLQYSSAQSTLLLPDKTVQAIIAEASGEIALHIAASSLISAAAAGQAESGSYVALAAANGRRRIADAAAQAYRLLEPADKGLFENRYKTAVLKMEGAFQHEVENLHSVALFAGEAAAREMIGTETGNLEKEKAAFIFQ